MTDYPPSLTPDQHHSQFVLTKWSSDQIGEHLRSEEQKLSINAHELFMEERGQARGLHVDGCKGVVDGHNMCGRWL